MTDKQREAIEALKESTAVTVGPDLIAQALGMSPGVLRKHVRDGDYMISVAEVCGSRIRFFRKDFLQKIGEEPPEEPEEKGPTVEQLLTDIRDELKKMNKLTLAGMDLRQKMTLMFMENDEKEPPAEASS